MNSTNVMRVYGLDGFVDVVGLNEPSLSRPWNFALEPPQRPIDRPGSAPWISVDRSRDKAIRLSQAVTRELIAQAAGRLLMFHAAGIANPVTGACLVAVAPSGTGKTMLASTLGAGRRYISDETIGVRPDGSIAPYPKPLSYRSIDEISKDELDPSLFEMLPPAGDEWVAGILVLRRNPDASDVQITELGGLEAMMELCSETSSLSRLPSPLRRLADLTNEVGVRRVIYRNAGQLTDLVDQILERTR